MSHALRFRFWIAAAGLAAGLMIIVLAGDPVRADVELSYAEFDGEHGSATAGNYIARTAAEWQALWRLANAEPQGDFKEGEHTGVGIFLGERPTGGYKVRVRKVVDDAGKIEVKMEEMIPTGIVTQVITRPYKIVLIRSTEGRTELAKRIDLSPGPE